MTHRTPTARRVKLLRTGLLWTVAGAGVGILASVVVSLLLGYRSVNVMSGSTEPAPGVGNVVMVRQVTATDIRAGDVALFEAPDDPGVMITHRVRSVEVRDGSVVVETEGNANTTSERWSMASDGKVGRVATHSWNLGYFLVWTRTGLGGILLGVIPALALGSLQIVRIWRRPVRERVAVAA